LLLSASAEDIPGRAPVASDPRQTIERTQAEERGILDEIREMDLELQALSVEMESLGEQRASQEQRLAGLQADVDAANRELDAHREAIGERVRALYRLNRRGLARIIFGAEDPYDLRRRSEYLLAIITEDAKRFEAFSEAATRKTAALSSAAEGGAALNDLNAEIQLKEADLRAQRDRKRIMLSEVREERLLAQQMLREMSVARQSFADPVSAPSSRPISQRGCGDVGNLRAFYGQLPWPLDGTVVQGFGPYFDAMGEQRRSEGLEIAAAYGTPVVAVFPGVVGIAENLRAYGDTVSLIHGDYQTVYTHLSRIRVRRSQLICPGDVIGNVGTTGVTDDSQPTLGFQVRYNGQPQDPALWLQK
ncbi:MAG: peptidoglycan DD-metalloendopeptidase family protein, partial [Myxococcota bacterium]